MIGGCGRRLLVRVLVESGFWENMVVIVIEEWKWGLFWSDRRRGVK